MKSRVHPSYKTMYRVTNWAEYEQGLVQRGDITIWLSPEAIAIWIACNILNAMTDLGRPKSVAIGA